jgi:dTDP-4-dehydrorhamnose 3,5-epimerase
VGGVISSAPAIDGVDVFPLARIGDERGMVLHMLRADASHFGEFGEVYFSLIHPGAVKAWKQHLRMVQNLAVPVGEIKLVLYDARAGSPTRGVTQEIVTGFDHYGLIRVPPCVWYGFKGMSGSASLIANCASLPHDPDEVERAAHDSAAIPYRW